MAVDPDEFFSKLEEAGEDKVRKTLAANAYHRDKKPLVVEWLRRKDVFHEDQNWKQRFNDESKERTKAQKFQAAQQEKQQDKQLEISEKHLLIARQSATAAIASAIVAILLLCITAVGIFWKSNDTAADFVKDNPPTQESVTPRPARP